MSRHATGRSSKNVMWLVAAALGAGVVTVALVSANDSRANHRDLTAMIVLDRSRVPAGGTVSGKVIFDNRGSKPKVMLLGCVVNGLYAIGFRAADGYLDEPAFTAVGCNPQQSMVAKPGRTIFRFKTRASYTVCGPGDRQPKRSRYWIPPCGTKPNGRSDIPSLPVGKYTAVFVPSAPWHGPRVDSASLSIVRAG